MWFLDILDFLGPPTMTISGLIFWLRVMKSDPQYVFGIPSTIFQIAGRDSPLPEIFKFSMISYPQYVFYGGFFSRGCYTTRSM